MWGGLLVRVAKKACTGGGVYICVKLPSEDLNHDSYPPYPTSTYTCGVTIAPRVCDSLTFNIILPLFLHLFWLFLFRFSYYKFVTLSHSMHIFSIQKMLSLSLSLSQLFFWVIFCWIFKFFLHLYLRLMNICIFFNFTFGCL